MMMWWSATFLLFCTSGALAAATGPGSWATIADLPGAREYLGAAALNGKIYVVGGWDGTSILKSGAVYDPATDSWSATASMSAARTALGLAALEGKVDEDMGRLFAVGGQDEDMSAEVTIKRVSVTRGPKEVRGHTMYIIETEVAMSGGTQIVHSHHRCSEFRQLHADI